MATKVEADIMPERDTVTAGKMEEDKCTYSCGFCSRDCPYYDPDDDDRYRLICDDFDLW